MIELFWKGESIIIVDWPQDSRPPRKSLKEDMMYNYGNSMHTFNQASIVIAVDIFKKHYKILKCRTSTIDPSHANYLIGISGIHKK